MTHDQKTVRYLYVTTLICIPKQFLVLVLNPSQGSYFIFLRNGPYCPANRKHFIELVLVL